MARSILAFVVVFLWGATAHAKLGIGVIQAAYGPLGAERHSLEYYPGDEIVFRYMLTGVNTNAKGEADVGIVVQVVDSAGKILLDRTFPTKGVVALGGGSVPGTATATLGASMKRGKYTLRVKAKDNLSGETASFQRDVKLIETAFTTVSQRFFMDDEGRVPGPAGGVVGQTLYFRFGLIGFNRSKGRVETRMDLEVLDEGGKQVLARPLKSTYRTEDRRLTQQISQVNFKGSFVLNRSGNFNLKFTFTDVGGGQNSVFEVPIRVTNP